MKRSLTTQDRDPNIMWMERGNGYVIPHEGRYLAVGNGIAVLRDADILMQTNIVSLGESVDRGQIITGTTPAWNAMRRELLMHPELFDYFPGWHRKFEEFVGGAYVEAQCSHVVLSPRSRDGGFDIAAYERGLQILDEVKAYRSSRFVTHQIVRAVLGLLVLHEDVNQVRVTTCSRFATNVFTDFANVLSDKLELRDRDQLLKWLRSMREPIRPQSDVPSATIN